MYNKFNEYEGFKVGDIVDIISKSIGKGNVTPYIRDSEEKICYWNFLFF